MYLRLSICISLVMFRIVFGIPFISTTTIESTPTTKWTDMNIYENMDSAPNYVEYKDEDSHAFKEQIQRNGILTTDSHDFLKEGDTTGTENTFTLFGNKEINKNTINEADVNQQVSQLETIKDEEHFKNDNTFESNSELQSSDFLSQMPSSSSDTIDLKEKNEQKEISTAQVKSDFKGEDVYKELPSESNVNIESNIQPTIDTFIHESITNSSVNDTNTLPINKIDSQTTLEKNADSQQKSEHKSLNDFILDQVTSKAVSPIKNEKETAQAMVSNDMIRYKTVIDEQIGKLERLLRKLEAVHDSDTKANLVDSTEHTIASNPENEEMISKNNIEFPRSFQTLKDVQLKEEEEEKAQIAQQKKTKEMIQKENDLINPKQQQTNIEKETIAKKKKKNLNNKLFRLIQSAQKTHVSGLEPNISTIAVTPSLLSNEDEIISFDPSNKIKLPNGSWTPSCKNVSKGFYCLKPDGEDSMMVQCYGENVGSQFSCGSEMMCYSIGPSDVDCQNNNNKKSQ